MRSIRIPTMFAAALVLAGLAPDDLGAQRADSAATARAAMREASAASARADTAGTLDALTRAARAWPRQGAYLLSLGRFAARTGQLTVARDALDRASQMGFRWSLQEPAFSDTSVQHALRDLAATAAMRTSPLLRGSQLHVVADSAMHPEGIAVDPRSGRLFVSSVRQGKVVVFERSGGVHRDFSTGHDAVFGMAVDTARSLLWLATSATPEWDAFVAADSNRAAMVAVDLESGRVRGAWSLPRDMPRMLGDVTIAPDGSVWATDSRTPTIWRVDPADSAAGARPVAIRSPDLVSLQGIAFRGDGKVAWIADWTTGLHRLDVDRGVVTPVAGDPLLFMLGIDGLYRESDRTLIAIQNGVAPTRVVRLHLDGMGKTLERIEVIERAVTQRGEPTLGTLAGGEFYYVANSPWDAYGANGRPRDGAVFERGVVRKVSLGEPKRR